MTFPVNFTFHSGKEQSPILFHSYFFPDRPNCTEQEDEPEVEAVEDCPKTKKNRREKLRMAIKMAAVAAQLFLKLK